MTQSKKYAYRIITDNAGWAVEIMRRKTTKQTVVSKRQDGFTSESDAQAWGEKELSIFVQNQNERNKRHSEKRKNHDQ